MTWWCFQCGEKALDRVKRLKRDLQTSFKELFNFFLQKLSPLSPPAGSRSLCVSKDWPCLTWVSQSEIFESSRVRSLTPNRLIYATVLLILLVTFANKIRLSKDKKPI